MRRSCALLGIVLCALVAYSASAVTMAWTPIGSPGNPCDPQGAPLPPQQRGCFGAVGYGYAIGTHEVTNSQYAEFLNAVASTDPNGLYNPDMGEFDPSLPGFGGITRSGSSGSFEYSVIPGRGDMPVTNVMFENAARFANWLHNGQPIGAQGPATTEDGAYAITSPYVIGDRKPGASVFLPTENEWYKAAYYAPASTSHFDYPAGSNAQMSCAQPTGAGNSANCGYSSADLTDVGSFPSSQSPFGTFDQGGNVWEWTETKVTHPGIYFTRRLRGGSFYYGAIETAASSGGSFGYAGGDDVGFRVAMIPEPGSGVLVSVGLIGLATSNRPRRGSRGSP